jgi:hypothetical protein
MPGISNTSSFFWAQDFLNLDKTQLQQTVSGILEAGLQ